MKIAQTTASGSFAELHIVNVLNIGTEKNNITKKCLFKYPENFTTKKWKISDKKKSDIFHISAQNIDWATR